MNKHKVKIGIDLSPRVILIHHRTLNGKFINKAYPISEKISQKEYLSTMREGIISFVKENRFKSASFSFTIPYDGTEGTLRILKLPVMDKKSLEKALKFEIEDSGMVDKLDLYHYKWSKAGSNSDDSKARLIVSVLKKELIAEMSKLKSISWNIESVEFHPVTIGRLIKGNAVVIDYGYDSTVLYYYLNGVIDDINFIPSGKNRVEEIIREIFPQIESNEMSEVQRQVLIYEQEGKNSIEIIPHVEKSQIVSFDINDLNCFEEGIDKDKIMEISFKLSQESKYIAEEVKRLVRQFELINGLNAEQIYCFGEVNRVHSLVDSLNENLDISVKPLETILFNEEILPVDAEFGLAYASTMSKDITYMKELNFVKDIKNNTDIGSMLVAVILMSVILQGGVYFTHNRYEKKLDEVFQIKSVQDNTIRGVQSEIDTLNQMDTENRELVYAVEGIGQERKWLSDFFYHLPEVTPNGITLSKIIAQDGIIILRGYSSNYSNIGLLAMEMEKLGNITIDYIDKKEDAEKTSLYVINSEPDETIETTNEFTIRIETEFPLITSQR